MQGTGCSEELRDAEVPPKSEVKNVPIVENKDGGALSEGTGVVVFR